MARTGAIALVIWALLWSGMPRVFAQGAHSAAVAPAGYDDAVNRAFRAFEAGQYTEARGHFLEAHALFPNARTLRALGKVEYELSHYDAALGYLEDALRSDERPLTSEQRAETEQLCDQLRGYVARVSVVAHPRAAAITVDGAPYAARSDGAMILTEGDHIVEVRADGYQAQQHSVHVLGGGDQQLEVTLLSSAGEPGSHEADGHGKRKIWLWVAVGSAIVAGAIVGSVVAASRGSDGAGSASSTTGVDIPVPARSAAR